MIKQAYFQGKNKKRRYFEGWYFKCISADRKQAIAIIPGMAIDPQGNRQAFIQVINAVTGKTWYHHFPYPEFNARADRFDVEIENNSFNAEGLSLNVDTGEGSIKGRLTFDNSHPFPKGLRHPGIMGPFHPHLMWVTSVIVDNIKNKRRNLRHFLEKRSTYPQLSIKLT